MKVRELIALFKREEDLDAEIVICVHSPTANVTFYGELLGVEKRRTLTHQGEPAVGIVVEL